MDTDRGFALLHAVGSGRAGPGVLACPEPEIDLEARRAVDELTGAIFLVSERRVRAVVITNLAHCQEAIEATSGLADESCVDLERIARLDGDGCDVAVRAR